MSETVTNQQEAVKSYNQNYYKNNKEEISMTQREKYKNDEEFRKRKKSYALKRYYEKKSQNKQVG